MENNIMVQEEWVNKTEGYRTGNTGVYESFTSDKGELYKQLSREYGRCTGKVFIDQEGTSHAIGWVFEKRVKYDDSSENYLLETWVTLHQAQPKKTIEYKYLFI